METIVFDDGSMRHSMSLCVTCPHSSAGMEAGAQEGAGRDRGRKRAVPRLCFLNCLEQQEAEGDRQVTHPPRHVLPGESPTFVCCPPTACWGAHRLVAGSR